MSVVCFRGGSPRFANSNGTRPLLCKFMHQECRKGRSRVPPACCELDLLATLVERSKLSRNPYKQLFPFNASSVVIRILNQHRPEGLGGIRDPKFRETKLDSWQRAADFEKSLRSAEQFGESQRIPGGYRSRETSKDFWTQSTGESSRICQPQREAIKKNLPINFERKKRVYVFTYRQFDGHFSVTSLCSIRTYRKRSDEFSLFIPLIFFFVQDTHVSPNRIQANETTLSLTYSH